MNYRSFVRDYLTLLGSRAAVDDKMKNKATSAETIESVIIASMLYCTVVESCCVGAVDRLDKIKIVN
jgi:hypothetical protein